eukprot:TRINITY_DN5896_c0_g1_i1.p1 TRINITY_DN5896_c0_g1~~TRINITY_DN5896_c0_g1_i1.p1  ORF type:complete len:737 (+),score=180.22 TRINITY_DN5896_c0_g1_i1:107-2317(+)
MEDEDRAVVVLAVESGIFLLHHALAAKTGLMQASVLLWPGIFFYIVVYAPSFWYVIAPGICVTTVLFFVVGDAHRSATAEWVTLCGCLLVAALGTAFGSGSPCPQGMKTLVAVSSCFLMLGVVKGLGTLEHNRLCRNDVVRSWERGSLGAWEPVSGLHAPLMAFEVTNLVATLRFGPMWWLRELSGANARTRKQIRRLLHAAGREELEYWLCRSAAPEVMFFLRPEDLSEALGEASGHKVSSLHPIAKAALIDALSKSGRLRDPDVGEWVAALILFTGRKEKSKPGLADTEMTHVHGGRLAGGGVLHEGIVRPDPQVRRQWLAAEISDLQDQWQRAEADLQRTTAMWTWPKRNETRKLVSGVRKLHDMLVFRRDRLKKLDMALRARAECLADFKAALDGGGTVHTLHDLVFNRLGAAHRLCVTQHFKTQAAIMPPELRGVKVISDLDDTIVCSGGRWPAGSDRRLHHGELYPGALSFLRELARCGPAGREGKKLSSGLVFLSARPHLYKDYMETKSYRQFRALADAGLLGQMATLLPGKLRPPIRDAWRYITRAGAKPWELVGANKARTVGEYQELYPEATLVFVGDDGQGDRYAAEDLLAEGKIVSAFIHSVIPPEDLRRRYSDPPEGMYVFRTYVEAAALAIEAKGATGFGFSAARRVAESAIRELNTMRIINKDLYPDARYDAYYEEIARDVGRLNEIFIRAGCEPIEIVQLNSHMFDLPLPAARKAFFPWRR